MKQTFFMLSLFIPGLIILGNDINIYLQPLIDELNDLWNIGVETYDVSKKNIFVCVQLYYGSSMIFLHMQIFQVGVLKGNLLVLFVIRIVLHFYYKTDGNGIT